MKNLKNEMIRLTGQIFRNTAYLRRYENQLTMIYGDTPETMKRTRERISLLKIQIDGDIESYERLNFRLIQAIEQLDDPRIQEILTRRYVSDESYEDIAEAMHYDIRWVYRLHQQGLVLTNPGAGLRKLVVLPTAEGVG